MKLSTRTRYGLRMLIDLAIHFNKGPLQISEISRLENISEKYLGQISIIMKNNGIIDSTRGAQGGFTLTKDPSVINLKEIVEILEGDLSIVNCTADAQDCERSAKCITRHIWEEVSNALKNTLAKYTLQDLVNMGKTTQDQMFYI